MRPFRHFCIVTAAALAAAACGPDPAGVGPAGPTPTTGDAAGRDEQTTGAGAIAARTAAAIHASVLTLDTHVDIGFDFATDAVDPATADLQVNLDKMEAGGLDAAFFIVYVGQTERTPDNYSAAQRDAMTKFDAIHRMTETLYPDRIELARSADDVERIVGAGKLAAAIGIENGYVIDQDLDLLDRYYELGARYVTLVHNGHNDLGDSAQPRPELGDEPVEHDGVSEFGAAAIRRMNALGIMVDISHASKATADQAIAFSAAPVIASHSSTRAVTDHVRNLDDETLQLLADKGGVVQIVAYDPYVSPRPAGYESALQALRESVGIDQGTDPETLDETRRERLTRGLEALDERYPPSTVAEFVDHIDHAVQLIGIDHVGISSDFGGGGGIAGWSDARETPNVTVELLDRGYSEDDIAKIWGGNLLRVWREVERVAASLE